MSNPSLPNEIIALIFDKLVQDGDSRSLSRCARLSHEFASWCQTLALHQVRLDCWNEKKVTRLGKTIKRNPNLASFVKVLDLEVSERGPWDTQKVVLWLLSKLNSLTSLKLRFDDYLSAFVPGPTCYQEPLTLRFSLALQRLAKSTTLVDLALYNVCCGSYECLSRTLKNMSPTIERLSWVVGPAESHSFQSRYCASQAEYPVFDRYGFSETTNLHALDISSDGGCLCTMTERYQTPSLMPVPLTDDAADLSELIVAIPRRFYASLSHLSIAIQSAAYHHPEFGHTDTSKSPYNGIIPSLSKFPPTNALETVTIKTQTTVHLLNGPHGLDDSEGLIDDGNQVYPPHSWWTEPHTLWTPEAFPALKEVAVDVVLITIDKTTGRTLPILPKRIVDELTGTWWGKMRFTVRQPTT